MKKTIIALVLIAAMLTAGCGAAATEPEAPADMNNVEVETQGDIAIEADPQGDMAAPLSMPSYIQLLLTVVQTDEGYIETTITPDDPENLDNIINLLTGESLVFDSKGNELSLADISEGDSLIVYVNAYAPAALILPVEYQASVIIKEAELKEDEQAYFTAVDTFLMNEEEQLVSAGNSLALNITEETEIIGAEAESLDKLDLLVFYGASTRSIPAMTSPVKVLVLGSNELALASIEAALAGE